MASMKCNLKRPDIGGKMERRKCKICGEEVAVCGDLCHKDQPGGSNRRETKDREAVNWPLVADGDDEYDSTPGYNIYNITSTQK